ncbi:MAG TPA: 50S ribosomal protein L4 [Candidatus Paceibacterota bacterium]
MQVSLYNQSGEIIGNVDLSDKIFGLKLDHSLVKQVLDAQVANSRQVIAHSKGRGEVRGGGKKPWKQKGTGRARHASIRSPIWKGGGVTFGPTKERNFSKKINKKMRRSALFMVLSSKIKDKEFMMLDNLNFEVPRTNIAVKAIKNISGKLDGYRSGKNKSDSILLVMPGQNKDVLRALNNLSFMNIVSADSLNVKDLLVNKYTILLKDAVPVIEKTYKI